MRFIKLLQPADTLRFNSLYEGIYGESPEVIRNQIRSSTNLARDFNLSDSIPEYNIYLYTNGLGNASEITEFVLSYQQGDTAILTSFKTRLPASLADFRLVTSMENPVLQLDYVEYKSNNTGSTEMSVAAFFTLDGFCIPLARVISKLWLSENGNYQAACKDYHYFSVEFSRDISFRNDHIKLGKGDYKFSQNLNCEAFNQKELVPASSYLIRDYMVLKEK